MDYLSGLSELFKGKMEYQILESNNFNAVAHRQLIIKTYKKMPLRIIEYGDVYAIEIKKKFDFFFSINNPDKILNIKEPLDIPDFPYKVYIKGQKNNPFLSETFKDFWRLFSSKITEIQLDNNESIFFYKNHLTLAVKPRTNLLPFIDDIIDTINIISLKDNYKINLKNIPVNLRPLSPFFKKWSVSGDAEREQLIEKTSERQKQKLINTVDPLMREINTFLNSFNDQPLNDEAMLIGNLAELVSELKLNSQDAGSVN